MGKLKKFLDFQSRFQHKEEVFNVRPIDKRDIETLRCWKNDHRHTFFHQEIILPTQQRSWYTNFSKNSDEQIFLCETKMEPVACVGFKKNTPQRIELFNLICGHHDYKGTGLMSLFYETIEKKLEKAGVNNIYLHVLKSNTLAQKWYQKQGYSFSGEDKNSYLMSRIL